MSRFSKPAFQISDQIALLESRGLIVPDHDQATHDLNNISYYRLSAYMRPFQEFSSEHLFKPKIRFSQIKDLYVFDKKLRMLLMDPLERIEVALRAQLTNTLALRHGSECLSNTSIFKPTYDHSWLIDTLNKKLDAKSSEVFLKHYRRHYSSPALPPIWMTLEILSFSEISRLFQNLKDSEDKQPLVSHFGWPDTLLASWFQALAVLRNTCAHHSRVWNREFSIKPKLPYRKHQPKDWPKFDLDLQHETMKVSSLSRRSRLGVLLVIIEALMRNLNPDSDWHQQLISLLEPLTPYELMAMGLEPGWNKTGFWARYKR